MVHRGGKSSRELAKRNEAAAELEPLSPRERAIIAQVAASPISRVRIEEVKPSPTHARVHHEKKISALAGAIRRFGIVDPIIVDHEMTIISGFARWRACQRLGILELPAIVVSHLSPAEIRALRIALGRFPEWASWDREQLRIELPAIVAELPDLSMEEIGFTVPEFDRLIAKTTERDPADDVPVTAESAPMVSRQGDLWRLGEHLVLCGDALSSEGYDKLLGSTVVQLVVSDPPYNVKLNGNVTKRSGKFAEFAMASGEMTDAQFREFLGNSFRQIARVCTAGAIGFFFIDWRHARLMQEAADGVFFELKNHIVWVKDSPGLGTFYKSQHEFVLGFKIAEGKHVNNFGLGQHGRTRSNVWEYPGMSSFGAGRDEALALHATPKPVAMLVDAILDCSNPGASVLDPFGGSGSTLIAAERTHRRARLIEINPLYVDTIVQRWERFTGEQAVLHGTNQSFANVAKARAQHCHDGEEGAAPQENIRTAEEDLDERS